MGIVKNILKNKFIMLAIIGGTGLYQIEALNIEEKKQVPTPFGTTEVIQATYQDKALYFLARHGQNHQFLPHEINYRANIYALKLLGVKQIVSLSAVGSLQEKIHPGDFVIPSQYFDFVKGNREKTFFGEGIAAHVSTAEPTCEFLTKWIVKQAQAMGIPMQTNKTYACVDGPRLGTRAESYFLRQAGCDLVGMTNVPEVFLAKEAQINYATIAIVTDYDCWKDDPDEHVSVADVIKRYGQSIEQAKSLLCALLSQEFAPIDEDKRASLRDALLTPQDAIPEEKQEMLEVLTS